jgi:hypothetical protein
LDETAHAFELVKRYVGERIWVRKRSSGEEESNIFSKTGHDFLGPLDPLPEGSRED